MSGPAPSVSLTPSQRAVMSQIVSYGRAKGFNDYQIDIAVKTAYIESKLGKELGPNPKGTASGLFGYTDATWDQGYGKKDSNSNQIRAFYDDLADSTWRYYDQPYGPIPTKDLTLAEYAYIKHHDGRYAPPSADSVGKRIWDSEPFKVPAGKNPPGPYETPPTSGPLKAFSYLDLARRPNALGPIPSMWDPGALPTGKNWLAGDSPLNLPAASANLPFQYSPNGATGPVPSGQAAPASMDYPARPLPSDSPFFPRRNAFLEPAQSMTPWAQPQSVGKGSPALPARNLLGPWPGSYLEGSPDVLQNGSRNVFDPWPGSYPPGRKNPVYPDIERLLGRPF